MRLGSRRASAWHDLGYGVRVRMRPCTSIEAAAAEAAAKAKVRDVLAGRDALAEIGLEPPDAAMLADPFWIVGLTRWLHDAALACRLIEAWEGVYLPSSLDGADDRPAPLTAGAVAELMRIEPVQRAFEAAAYADLALLLDEGKESPPPPSGSAAEAANTAPGAATPEPPAPTAAEIARSTGTGR